MRSRSLLVALGLALAGCSDQLDLGNDLLWTADQESGDLSQWTAAGEVRVPDAANVEVTQQVALRGRHALKLENPANWDNAEEGPELLHDAGGLGDAYYSAWFLLPEQYRIEPQVTVMRLRSRDAETGELYNGEELQLRSLPDGGYVTQVFSNNSGYLLEPLAISPPRIEPGRWFQLEARYESRSAGRLRVWVDGELTYDLEPRPGAAGSQIVLGICNVVERASPAPLTLFVDDAAVSSSRVTPGGRF
jgi:hypothetical protein